MTGIKNVNFHLNDDVERGCFYETDDIQIMRIRLSANEALPHHKSNANVLLTPLTGTIRLVTADGNETAGVGEALSVPYNTPMDVTNAGDDVAVFLVIKTPHPKTFK